jgi:cytochrome P450
VLYGPYIIPANTPMSMNHYCAHHDERIFPDSHAFVPERWLDNPRAPVLNTYGTVSAEKGASTDVPGMSEKGDTEKGGRLLSRYMVAFNRGTRMCIGMNLAWAESYLMLASVIRRCDLEIFETEWKDVGFLQDFFVPHSAPDARGLRVKVKNVV